MARTKLLPFPVSLPYIVLGSKDDFFSPCPSLCCSKKTPSLCIVRVRMGNSTIRSISISVEIRVSAINPSISVSIPSWDVFIDLGAGFLLAFVIHRRMSQVERDSAKSAFVEMLLFLSSCSKQIPKFRTVLNLSKLHSKKQANFVFVGMHNCSERYDSRRCLALLRKEA
ncbi:unnamed protein product [Albugo candida]|uniref:Uncharacterized protein n=1 Tax=Albugo candida TaxID=65357 RepID=A0A024G6E5_9STRA|nr:unnamed protein product [Albugo candida]|eukprot:CCI42327.1 unnamed protein product [Albugo candida]